MTGRLEQIEREIVELTERIRLESIPALEAIHLRVDEPSVSRAEGPNGASTELAMNVTKDGDLVDVIEFHIVRNGEPVTNAVEIENWLRQTFTDVVRRAQST